jgi:hypothetical protein
VISLSDTSAEPVTVVIEPGDAAVAHRTVVRASGSVDLARGTELALRRRQEPPSSDLYII